MNHDLPLGFYRTICLLLVFLLLSAASLEAQDSYHSLTLGAGTAIPAQGLEVSLEYAMHWQPISWLGIRPYVKINLNALDTLGAWVENFQNANTWAGENTVAFNIALVGIPYLVAAVISTLQSQYIFCPGFEISYHPLRTTYFDSSLGIGLANNPYRVFQERDDVVPLYLYPITVVTGRATFLYKAFIANLWASYEYELFAEGNELNPHGFHWGADLGWRFGIRP